MTPQWIVEDVDLVVLSPSSVLYARAHKRLYGKMVYKVYKVYKGATSMIVKQLEREALAPTQSGA